MIARFRSHTAAVAQRYLEISQLVCSEGGDEDGDAEDEEVLNGCEERLLHLLAQTRIKDRRFTDRG